MAAERQEQRQRPLPPAGGEPAASPSPSSVKVKATTPLARSEYEVDGHRFALIVEHDACYVSPRDSPGREARLPLGWFPPCHLLLWRRPPPVERPRDAVPLGQVGDPMAWKFAGRQPVVALVIVAPPAPAPSSSRASPSSYRSVPARPSSAPPAASTRRTSGSSPTSREGPLDRSRLTQLSRGRSKEARRTTPRRLSRDVISESDRAGCAGIRRDHRVQCAGP